MQKYIYLKIKQVLETKNKMDPVNRVDTSLSILISVILLRINFTSKIVGKLEDSPKLTANGVKKEKIWRIKQEGLPYFQPEFQKRETSWRGNIKERTTETSKWWVPRAERALAS